MFCIGDNVSAPCPNSIGNSITPVAGKYPGVYFQSDINGEFLLLELADILGLDDGFLIESHANGFAKRMVTFRKLLESTAFKQATFGNNTLHNDFAYAIGDGNVVGGVAGEIISYDEPTNSIRMKSTNSEDLVVTDYPTDGKIHINISRSDDYSPYEKIIVSATQIDYATVEVVLNDISDLVSGLEQYITDEYGYPTGMVADPDKEWIDVGIGEYNQIAGNNSFGIGNGLVMTGNNSYGFGMLNEIHASNSQVAGTYNIAIGDDLYVTGITNKVKGQSTIVMGSSNTTDGVVGNIILGDSNTLTANAIHNICLGKNNTIAARMTMALGMAITNNADQAASIGRTLINDAPGAVLIGSFGRLPERLALEASPESGIDYRDAVAIAGGFVPSVNGDQESLFLVLSKYRYSENPLYVPEGNEDQYLREAYRLATLFCDIDVTGIIKENGNRIKSNTPGTVITSAEPILDFNIDTCWKLEPTISTTPALFDWSDGDSGRLIVTNGSLVLDIPTTWNIVGTMPTFQSDGYDVFKIEQIFNDIFITHEFSKTN